MADFAADFRSAFVGMVATIDAFDFSAVFSPYVAVADAVPPLGTAVTMLAVPVAPTDPLVIQITDLIEVKNLVVGVKFGTWDWELAYDGQLFSPRYKTAGSDLTKTSGVLWTLTLKRYGGWPSSPTVVIRAVDGAGNMS